MSFMNSRICFYSPPLPRVKTYYDMIDASVEFGLKYIEGFNIMEFETPDKEAAKKIRKYADSKGIKFSCVSIYINLVYDDYKEQLEVLKGYADVAAILGSPYLHHTIANEFSDPQKVLPHKELFFERGLWAVREIYDYCESLGLRTIYEEQGYLFNGINGYKRFLDEVDRNIGVLADFANICQAGEKIEDFIEAFSDKIVHAHIKDVVMKPEKGKEGLLTLNGDYMHAVPINQGEVDIRKGIELLKASGFNGYYGIEYGAAEDDVTHISDILGYVDGILA